MAQTVKNPPTNAWNFPYGSSSKEFASNAGKIGDAGSIPGLGRSPGGRNGNQLQYSCLESPMDWGDWQSIAHGSQRVGHDWACTHT